MWKRLGFKFFVASAIPFFKEHLKALALKKQHSHPFFAMLFLTIQSSDAHFHFE